MNTPLAERLRPTTLSDYISQQHLVGPQGALTQGLKQGLIPSMILWGPPGIGKTTLATIIAKTSDRPFYTLSAINSGVKDVPQQATTFFQADRIRAPQDGKCEQPHPLCQSKPNLRPLCPQPCMHDHALALDDQPAFLPLP